MIVCPSPMSAFRSAGEKMAAPALVLEAGGRLEDADQDGLDLGAGRRLDVALAAHDLIPRPEPHREPVAQVRMVLSHERAVRDELVRLVGVGLPPGDEPCVHAPRADEAERFGVGVRGVLERGEGEAHGVDRPHPRQGGDLRRPGRAALLRDRHVGPAADGRRERVRRLRGPAGAGGQRQDHAADHGDDRGHEQRREPTPPARSSAAGTGPPSSHPLSLTAPRPSIALSDRRRWCQHPERGPC